MFLRQPDNSACKTPGTEETLKNFRDSSTTDSFTRVTDAQLMGLGEPAGIDFSSINTARGKCRDECAKVDKCKGFYFEGRTTDKDRNVCNLYSACEVSTDVSAVGSLYIPFEGPTDCCKPLTLCKQSQFAVTSPPEDGTATFNRVCKDLKVCSADQYQSKAPTATSDRECSNLTTCDYTKEYESTAPTETSDRECSNLATCDYSKEYESTAPTATTNRVCSNLATCDYSKEYESTAPTATTNRVCSNLTTCDYSKEYESTAPTATSNRVCSNLATCDYSKEYESTAPTATTNRECSNLIDCKVTEYISVKATPTSNRKCAPYTMSCPEGQWLDVTTAKTLYDDHTCRNLTVCDDDEFESVAPKAASDRKCEKYRDSCPKGQWLDFGTPTENRQCKDYTLECPADSYLDNSTKSNTSDAQCLPKKPRGQPCSGSFMCLSGNCKGGVCACKEGHYCPDAGLRDRFKNVIDTVPDTTPETTPPPPVKLDFGKLCTDDTQCKSGNCNQGSCCQPKLTDSQCAICNKQGWCKDCKDGYAWSNYACREIKDCEGSWGNWSACTDGVQVRNYNITQQPQTNKGKKCPDPLSEVKRCSQSSEKYNKTKFPQVS